MRAPVPSPARRPRGAVRAWLTWWVLLAGLWLVLVDQVVLPEDVVGAVAVTIAASATVLVRAQRDIVLRPRARWLRRALRPLAGQVTDLPALAHALWRRGVLRRDEQGTLVQLPYRAVDDTPEHAAHRALTEALGSLAPNTIVVEIDRDRRVLLAHQLVPSHDPRRDAAPLGDAP